MAGIKSLFGMGLTGSAGMTLLILACTLEKQNWWPAISTIFYIISPLPILIARHISYDGGFGNERNQAREWAYFLTTGIVMSAFALPILLARTNTIQTAATVLSLCSSVFTFFTILAFFIVFQSDSNGFDDIY